MDISIQRVDRVLERIKSITTEVQNEVDNAEQKCKCPGLYHEMDCSLTSLLVKWIKELCK